MVLQVACPVSFSMYIFIVSFRQVIGLQKLRVGKTLTVVKKGSGRRLDKVMKSHKAFET